MDNSTDEIVLSYVRIKYEAPIVYFEYKEGTELGFPEIFELIASAEKLSGREPYVTFSDARVSMNLTNEGKKAVADQNMPLFRGTAALVNNSLYKFAANYLTFYNRSKYPFRAFTNKDEAIKWLLSLPLEEKA